MIVRRPTLNPWLQARWRRWRTLAPVLALGVSLATCETVPDVQESVAEVGDRVALVAVDLDALDAALRSPSGPGSPGSPSGPSGASLAERLDVSLWVDGAPVARTGLARAGSPPEGRLTWALTAGDHTITVVARDSHTTRRGHLRLTLPTDTLTPVVVGTSPAEPPTLLLQAGQAVKLPDATGVTVDYRSPNLPQGWQQRLGPQPAARLAAMLLDPELAVLTPVTQDRSSVDRVGPLVPWQPTAAPAARARAGTRSRPSASTATHRPSATAARVAALVPALVRTYTYCTCGKPVPNRPFTLRTTDQREFSGRTDRHGLVIIRNAELASVNYGHGQRARKRSYRFEAGTQETREHMLVALRSDDPNEALTALLDLRRAQLPSARATLLELLDHSDPVWWRNAALALGHYDAVQAEAAERTRLLRAGVDMPRQLFILGALRRATAIPALLPFLGHARVDVRRQALWALGFIGHPDAAPAVSGALADADPSVRAAAALALGRCGDASDVAALEPLLGDAHADVAARAKEGVALLLSASADTPR